MIAVKTQIRLGNSSGGDVDDTGEEFTTNTVPTEWDGRADTYMLGTINMRPWEEEKVVARTPPKRAP